jgi:hypothetical protein
MTIPDSTLFALLIEKGGEKNGQKKKRRAKRAKKKGHEKGVRMPDTTLLHPDTHTNIHTLQYSRYPSYCTLLQHYHSYL